jgi:hypothetical protein
VGDFATGCGRVSSPENSDDKKPAGRVRHDSTGRAIWEWAAESGRHALESTSLLLKRLDLPGLALADDDKKKDEDEETHPNDGRNTPASPVSTPRYGNPGEKDPAAHSRRSFNPYDTRTPAVRVAPKPKPKPVARITQPPRKRGFFARLFGRKP